MEKWQFRRAGLWIFEALAMSAVFLIILVIGLLLN